MADKKIFLAALLGVILFSCGGGNSTTPAANQVAPGPPGITRTLQKILDPDSDFQSMLTTPPGKFDIDQNCIQYVLYSDGRKVVELCNAACDTTGAILPQTSCQWDFVLNSVGQLQDSRNVAVGVVNSASNPTTVTELCTSSFSNLCQIQFANLQFSGYTPLGGQ